MSPLRRDTSDNAQAELIWRSRPPAWRGSPGTFRALSPPPTLPAPRQMRRTSHEPQAPQADSQQDQAVDTRLAPGCAPPVPHALRRGGLRTCSKENMMLNWLRCYRNSMAKINHFRKREMKEEGGERDRRLWRTNKRKQSAEIDPANFAGG